jgi:hypothetical protein
MTLHIYAHLFDSDLDSVAENVSKLWPQEAKKETPPPPDQCIYLEI